MLLTPPRWILWYRAVFANLLVQALSTNDSARWFLLYMDRRGILLLTLKFDLLFMELRVSRLLE